MKRIYLGLTLSFLLAACGGGGESSESSKGLEELALTEATGAIKEYTGNVDTGACYEIFVYSFADSDGDGIGDLKGIEEKLDYLQELGVKNLWLTPIHPSSTYHKYNVRDYFSIDPAFGSVADFESLAAKAKQKGMGIIMDMVFNHSSIDNPWFLKAVEDFAYKSTSSDSLADLYVFGDQGSDVPNKKATYRVGDKIVWYECNFDNSMPEFNLSSPLAKAKHKEIMEYWLGKGASGFRFDGVAYYEYGNPEKTMEYVNYLSQTAKTAKSDVYLIGEYWENAQPTLNAIAKNGMTGFNFPTSARLPSSILFSQKSGIGDGVAATIEGVQRDFLANSDGKILPSFFLTNHDQDRWAGSMEDDQIALAARMYLFTAGTPYMYYGEEIKLLGTRQTAQTDANRRLPMQWIADASKDAARPKPCREGDYSGDQTTLGALEAIKDTSSVTYAYKQILAFRAAHEELQKGCYRSVSPEESQLCAFRIDQGSKTTYLIHNVDYTEVTVDVGSGKALDTGFPGGKVALNGTKLTLGPYASAYLVVQN